MKESSFEIATVESEGESIRRYASLAVVLLFI
jgi:hypothetical protein